ncbi:MAG: hypothetical protein KC418_00050 [Anaerolineales bacterium]|nr:hypothetical protein [Anaerolineales bacterium]MCB8950917.1 hypothetical protein [Ardenticatenales bacterium]
MNAKVSSMLSFFKSKGRIRELLAWRLIFLEDEDQLLSLRVLAHWHRPSLRKLLRRMKAAHSLETDAFWQQKMEVIQSY